MTLLRPKVTLKAQGCLGDTHTTSGREKVRDLALFNPAIDSKLRGCDLVKIRVRDICHGSEILRRTTVVQQKAGQPVQIEITPQTKESIVAWIEQKIRLPTYFDRCPSLLNLLADNATRNSLVIPEAMLAGFVDGMGARE